MEEAGNEDGPLIQRIKQLERERDDLQKDIEQLCMQQAGPSYLAVATRIHFQRTAGLEQEIEILRKKLAACVRDNQNLQEELSEAYRIKSQLADLHSAEASKNIEAEKQIKFFQSCVASAFAERDNSLMEAEKAREQEEGLSEKLHDYENRLQDLESAYFDEKKNNTFLQMELKKLKEQKDSFEKVISKLYEVRERATGFSECISLEAKCSTLLDDPAEMWIFDSDGKHAPSSYIDLNTKQRIGTGREDGGLYLLELGDSVALHTQASGDLNQQISEIQLWHSCFGHLSFRSLRVLFPSLFHGINLASLTCHVCHLAKSCRIQFPNSINKSSAPFELVHSDVWGLPLCPH